MGECHDFDVVGMVSINHEEGEPSDREAMSRPANTNALHLPTDVGMFGDHLQRVLNLTPELISEPGTFVFVS